MDFVLDGYCGLYCGACPVLLGTRAETESSPCHGCKSEQHAPHCATCGIRTCAHQKGYEFCYECADLAVCEQMQRFMADEQWLYHQGVLKNMEAIHREGRGEWLENQEARWQCAHCGAPHSWWNETCPRCGQAFASYRADLGSSMP
jgi:hypothetical protein